MVAFDNRVVGVVEVALAFIVCADPLILGLRDQSAVMGTSYVPRDSIHRPILEKQPMALGLLSTARSAGMSCVTAAFPGFRRDWGL
jgi:hypothetical protein